MNNLRDIAIIISLLSCTWYFRQFINRSIKYKEARAMEIKRRLQVEHKQDQNLEQLLKSPMDDREKAKLVAKFARERHQRQIYYVIQDSLERWH